ncbi:MAG: aldo/keto reductase, partial [Aquificales bacterium]|nr:aldo/keto reductase [Aquificales bacterium]
RPNTFLNTACDVDLLPKILNAASRFQPTDPAELDAKMAQIRMAPLFV